MCRRWWSFVYSMYYPSKMGQAYPIESFFINAYNGGTYNGLKRPLIPLMSPNLSVDRIKKYKNRASQKQPESQVSLNFLMPVCEKCIVPEKYARKICVMCWPRLDRKNNKTRYPIHKPKNGQVVCILFDTYFA